MSIAEDAMKKVKTIAESSEKVGALREATLIMQDINAIMHDFTDEQKVAVAYIVNKIEARHGFPISHKNMGIPGESD
jgi:hypothetical protein